MPLNFAKENKKADQMKADYENQIENLYTEVGRLTMQLSWLKKIWYQEVVPSVFKYQTQSRARDLSVSAWKFSHYSS